MYGDEKGSPVVAVAAPTGLAALNINGITMHKLLKLPVQHGVEAEFWNLGKPDIKAMRASFKNVRLFIIDEVSMVSNVLLTSCHVRFNELFVEKEGGRPFGGVALVVFGDLLQLPPARSEFCFQPLSRATVKKHFRGVSVGYNLWKEFYYFELTENMRQKDDLAYAEMLNRARIGSLTKDDKSKLNKRLVFRYQDGSHVVGEDAEEGAVLELLNMEECAEYFMHLQQKDVRCLALLPKNEQVDSYKY